MKHYANPDFWELYNKLPKRIRKIADKNFKLLKENPDHPSLHFKKVGRFWSVRISKRYRALSVETSEGLVWFWIGTHSDYNNMIK